MTNDEGGGRERGGRKGSPRPRRSREATIEVILNAAEELFAAEGPEVSVRDIAARAELSHALVHRYLGHKDQILDAVITRDQGRMLRAAGDEADLRKALALVFRQGLGPDREYLTLLVHAVLHGLPWDPTAKGSPAARRLVDLAAQEPEQGREAPNLDPFDHRFVIASVIAMALGWVGVEPWLVKAADLEDLDQEQITEGLILMALRMLGEKGGTAE